MKTVTVILSGYKRKHTTQQQVLAFKNQSYPVRIIYLANGIFEDHPTDYKFLKEQGVELVEMRRNHGIYMRFRLATFYPSDFYCIIDDDMIPGKDFIKTCVECYEEQPGIYGGHGVRDRAFDGPLDPKYFNHHGWVQTQWQMNGPKYPLQVAYLMNCWFFPKVALEDFWRERPTCNLKVGEDIHLSLMAFLHSDLRSYVIPANRHTPDKLMNTVGIKYSEDVHALSKDPKLMAMSKSYYEEAVKRGLPVFRMRTYTDNDGESW